MSVIAGITPIPTVYDGCTFRSRLEARWASYLTICRIRWEYEPEGFQLDSGWYLPDFLLPDLGIIVEVKPPLKPPHDAEKMIRAYPTYERMLGELVSKSGLTVLLLAAGVGGWGACKMLETVSSGGGVSPWFEALPDGCADCGMGFLDTSWRGREHSRYIEHSWETPVECHCGDSRTSPTLQWHARAQSRGYHFLSACASMT